MFVKSFLANVAGILVIVCLKAPPSGSESLVSLLQGVDGEEFASRVNDGQLAGPGTTLNIKDIVIGRCWEYQRVTGRTEGKPTSEVDCDNVAWPTFAKDFAYKEPCATTEDAFSNFINVMTVSLPVNATIFWSGTKNVALTYSQLSGGSLFSLEATFLGSTVNGLTWCGSVHGINYKSCPAFDDSSCQSPVSTVFWGAVSMSFAKQARGAVGVILDGSDSRGAFRNNSFFALVELPSLDTTMVHLVNIIVVHGLYKPVVDTCDNGTILILKDRIIKRGLQWTCEDDPKLARLIQCTENPDNEKCNLGSGVRKLHSISLNIVVFIVLSLLWLGTG